MHEFLLRIFAMMSTLVYLWHFANCLMVGRRPTTWMTYYACFNFWGPEVHGTCVVNCEMVYFHMMVRRSLFDCYFSYYFPQSICVVFMHRFYDRTRPIGPAGPDGGGLRAYRWFPIRPFPQGPERESTVRTLGDPCLSFTNTQLWKQIHI